MIALITLAATFPLIFMGGLVTSKQAGLSVPDWPNSYGYNMFLFPPRLWQGGIFFEHTHRLGATVVGMLSIILCAWAWITDRRKHVRYLGTAVLLGVIFQGILGGLRVVLVNLDLAMVHACVAQAFFCLVGLMALVTSRSWNRHETLPNPMEAQAGRKLVFVSLATFGIIYAQLIVAAIMRHTQAGLAVPDIPLIYGKFIPPTTQSQLATINQLRVWKLDLPPVTLGQIWLHTAHRVGAIIVSLAILATAGHVFYWHRKRPILVVLSVTMILLLILQVTLGLATVYFRKPADVASAHVAVGALVLLGSFVLACQSVRRFRPRDLGPVAIRWRGRKLSEA